MGRGENEYLVLKIYQILEHHRCLCHLTLSYCHIGTIILERKVACLQPPSRDSERRFPAPTPGVSSPRQPPPVIEPLPSAIHTGTESAPGGLPANPGCGTAWGQPGKEYLQEQTRGGQPGRLAQHLLTAHSLGARPP